MVKVYGVNLSPFVRKVRVALAEKNLSYELEPVLPFAQSEEFKKLSPLGKIPVYRDGDFTVPDSSVIISYLEQTQPQPALYPSDPKECARALFLEEYADTKLVETALTPFVQRIVNKRFLKQECDEAVVRRALTETLPPVLDYLEGQVSSGDAIVGESFSVADIAIASPFVNFMHGGEEVDPSRWPKLAGYLRAVYARASFRTLIAEETRDLS